MVKYNLPVAIVHDGTKYFSEIEVRHHDNNMVDQAIDFLVKEIKVFNETLRNIEQIYVFLIINGSLH